MNRPFWNLHLFRVPLAAIYMNGPFGWIKIPVNPEHRGARFLAKGASVARWNDNHCSGKLSLEETVEEAEQKTSWRTRVTVEKNDV